MAKKYYITQKLNLNGKPVSVTLNITCDEAELDAFLALLEGGYEVKEVIKSDLVGANALVASTNPIVSIGLVGDLNGNPVYESIRPYSGAIHFKNTVSADDITDVLKLTTPFALAPAEKPKRVTFKGYEVR